MDVFGLLGNPVGHSLSPPMHEAAYEELEYDARYVTFEPDPDDLEAAIEGAEALGITGLNVTIPFKQDALAVVDADDLATRIGAVNTIDFTGEGGPTGHNTDAGGAMRALRDHDVTIDGARAVVVGAGGAGRAIAFGLADAGASVAIANRTVSSAHDLAEEVPRATSHGLESLESLLADADVLVNATSVGMEEDATPVPADAFTAIWQSWTPSTSHSRHDSCRMQPLPARQQSMVRGCCSIRASKRSSCGRAGTPPSSR